MSKINLHPQILPDGEFLYRKYWTEMGTSRSLGKLRDWCYENGYFRKTTGKKATTMGIWLKMWRWALTPENQDEAEKIFNNAMKDVGEFYTHKDWVEYLKSRAKCGSVMTARQYDKFLESVK